MVVHTIWEKCSLAEKLLASHEGFDSTEWMKQSQFTFQIMQKHEYAVWVSSVSYLTLNIPLCFIALHISDYFQ